MFVRCGILKVSFVFVFTYVSVVSDWVLSCKTKSLKSSAVKSYFSDEFL